MVARNERKNKKPEHTKAEQLLQTKEQLHGQLKTNWESENHQLS
jgi:hypothetical protein